MAWRTARSLDVLLLEVNASAPNRDKASDGSIGDAGHRSRVSDHNPWAPVGLGGVVTARDFDHDPKGGLDCSKLAEHLRRRGHSGDRRVKYVIFDRRIASARDEWAWRPYSGENAHRAHLHVSVSPIQSLFDDESPWGWKVSGRPVVPVSSWGSWYTGRLGARTVNRWDCGVDVKVLQTFIGDTATDGYFGSDTEAAVRAYQRMRGLTPDGIVGARTWAPILRRLGV